MSLFSTAEEIYHKAISLKTDKNDLETIVDWPLDSLAILFSATDSIRRYFFKDTIEPCAIMNIKSGGCTEDCAFCSQSSHNNAEISVKDLSHAHEIIDAYQRAQEKKLSFGVVSSGRKLSPHEIQKLAGVFQQSHGTFHASLGILSDDEFRILKEAGVTCYNHNLETSRHFFPSIVSTHTYDQRIETVKRAKKAGLSVCCGGIFGLGEKWSDRVDLCIQLKELDVDTIPINFLNAIHGTKVSAPRESALDFLKIVCLFRVGLPNKKIKVCGGREVNLKDLQNLMFFAGANGYISGDYLTTSGDSVAKDDEMLQLFNLKKNDKIEG